MFILRSECNKVNNSFNNLKKKTNSKILEFKKLKEENKKKAEAEQERKRKIEIIKTKWLKLMANAGLYNKNKDTYSLNQIEITNYGFKCKIYMVDCCTYTELSSDSVRDKIESKYSCMLVLEKDRRSDYAIARFIQKVPDVHFVPIKGLKPYELYIGNEFDGSPIIVSLIKYPHLLLSGGTRAGKEYHIFQF